MKSSDFIDENAVTDWAARRGWLGQTRQAVAYDKRDMEIANKKWFTGFYSRLQQKFKSNGLAETRQNQSYSSFNHLVESIIANEAVGSVDQVVKEFLMYEITVNNKLRPTQQQLASMDNAINEFVTAYTAAGSRLNPKIAEILSNAVWNIVYSSQEQSAPAGATPLGNDQPPDKTVWTIFYNRIGAGGKLPVSNPMSKSKFDSFNPPGSDITPEPRVITENRDFRYDFVNSVWIDVTGRSLTPVVGDMKVTTTATIDKLNKLFHAYYRL